jgi:hypothetical protein
MNASDEQTIDGIVIKNLIKALLSCHIDMFNVDLKMKSKKYKKEIVELSKTAEHLQETIKYFSTPEQCGRIEKYIERELNKYLMRKNNDNKS